VSTCPYCTYVTPEPDYGDPFARSWQEVAHMQCDHPDIIAQRLRDIGEIEPGLGFHMEEKVVDAPVHVNQRLPYYQCPEHGPLVNADAIRQTVGRAEVMPGIVRCADCGVNLEFVVPSQPFDLEWTSPLTQEEVNAVAAAVQALTKQFPSLNYRLAITDAWICVRVGGRRSQLDFGMWRASMLWYEADEHGAMGEDPVDLDKLTPRWRDETLTRDARD
jgi:hypothetical protein